jgi:transposase-like protein
MTALIATCPHCDKETGVELGFESCGEHVCPHCKKMYNVYVDEDMDCNYWFATERE